MLAACRRSKISQIGLPRDDKPYGFAFSRDDRSLADSCATRQPEASRSPGATFSSRTTTWSIGVIPSSATLPLAASTTSGTGRIQHLAARFPDFVLVRLQTIAHGPIHMRKALAICLDVVGAGGRDRTALGRRRGGGSQESCGCDHADSDQSHNKCSSSVDSRLTTVCDSHGENHRRGRLIFG